MKMTDFVTCAIPSCKNHGKRKIFYQIPDTKKQEWLDACSLEVSTSMIVHICWTHFYIFRPKVVGVGTK